MYSRTPLSDFTSLPGRRSLRIRPLKAGALRISRPRSKPSIEIFQSYGSWRNAGSIAGSTVGSADRSVTDPMLRGRRLQVLIVTPWPLMRIRPWSTTYAGRQWIWMSGERTSLLERRNAPASATQAVTGPVL